MRSSKLYAFSDLSTFKNLDLFSHGAVIDTNLLIAGAYELHHFHEDSFDLFETLARFKIPLYTTVTVRTEYIDFFRRVRVTEALMDIYSNTKKFKLSKRVKEELKKHYAWINLQSQKDLLPALSNYRIKETKMIFDPIRHSGHLGWLEFCNEFLAGRILASWEHVESELGVNYLQLRGNEAHATHLKKSLDWRDMYKVVEKTAVSSNDGMLLNAFFSSHFQVFLTADFDVAYAITVQNDPMKSCFVPDSLYKKLSKINFQLN